jgi:hypothetical protein
MRPLLVAVFVGCCVLGSCTAAQAQGGTPSPAQALFDEGHAAYDNGEFQLACRKFSESQSLEPAGGTLMSLADCEEHIGELLKARAHYNAALSLFTGSDPRIPFMKKRLRELEPRIPTLTLTLDPATPSGASIELNGFPLLGGELGSPVPVNPGTQQLVVATPGHAARKYETTLQEGETARLVLSAGPFLRAGPGSPTESPATDKPGERDYTAAWVVGGMTLGAGVVAVALSVRAFTHYQDLAKTCAKNVGGCPQDDRDAVASEAVVANVLYGVAGVGAVATLVLAAFAPSANGDSAVSVVPSGHGLALRLRL